jgi:hypothetical protein
MKFVYRMMAWSMLPPFGVCMIFAAGAGPLYQAMEWCHGKADRCSLASTDSGEK